MLVDIGPIWRYFDPIIWNLVPDYHELSRRNVYKKYKNSILLFSFREAIINKYIVFYLVALIFINYSLKSGNT